MMLEIDSDGIPKFDQPQKYRQYAKNVDAKDPYKARKARILAVKLQAQLDGAESVVEQECLEAMYAYEWTLFKKHGRWLKAAYLRRAIKKNGVIKAVDNAVSKGQETAGYHALVGEGMQDMLFEAVVLRHPEVFSAEAVAKSTQRMAGWKATGPGND
jgi:hypothetical protein